MGEPFARASRCHLRSASTLVCSCWLRLPRLVRGWNYDTKAGSACACCLDGKLSTHLINALSDPDQAVSIVLARWIEPDAVILHFQLNVISKKRQRGRDQRRFGMFHRVGQHLLLNPQQILLHQWGDCSWVPFDCEFCTLFSASRHSLHEVWDENPEMAMFQCKRSKGFDGPASLPKAFSRRFLSTMNVLVGIVRRSLGKRFLRGPNLDDDSS